MHLEKPIRGKPIQGDFIIEPEEIFMSYKNSNININS
jgi:hypothetical protein